ncbi:hypothetical protein AB1K91_02600 [Terribacillus sp. 179-K 1B1 HS]|uniref:hypothetical protein n=1 Tax=Terribacillus sp. 179-K 1B1 HS TaxID=3142388 RepID=UPI0039A167E7
MKYTLYLAQAGDDARTVYSYILTNFEGEKRSGIFVATGEHKHDEEYCSHVALQRALRDTAKEPGVIQLTVHVDGPLVDPIIFQVEGINSPLYPSLAKTTTRLMKRFSAAEFAATDFNDDDASWQEIATMDNALDQLEYSRTIKGRWQLLCDRLFNPTKIIR